MKISFDLLTNIRIQVINSVLNSSDIEDVIFTIGYNDHSPNVGQAMVPYTNLKSPNDKYLARKQVVNRIKQKTLSPDISMADQVYFFSYDLIYNVDYCFYFDSKADSIKLIVYRKDGEVILSNNYNEDFDERPFLFSETVNNDFFNPEPNTSQWLDLKGLFHITHIDNLKNIIEQGILSHTISHVTNVLDKDISNQLVQSRRTQIHNKVPFYFNILNPMTFSYKYKDDMNTRDLVVLCIDKKIMLQPGTIFTDGNAASSSTKFFSSLEDLDKLDWDCIFSHFWNEFDEGKRKRCSEVLIPYRVPTRFIKNIFLKDQTHFNKLKVILSDFSIPVAIDESYFF